MNTNDFTLSLQCPLRDVALLGALACACSCGGKLDEASSTNASNSQDAGHDVAFDAASADTGGRPAASGDSSISALTPLPNCAVTSGAVLYIEGFSKSTAFAAVTYATSDTIQVSGENAQGQWTISVSSNQLGRPLARGEYENAQHLGTEHTGEAGFDFEAIGVPPSCDGSRFFIDAISVSEPDLKAFTVDFEYTCAGSERVRGCFRYDR